MDNHVPISAHDRRAWWIMGIAALGLRVLPLLLVLNAPNRSLTPDSQLYLELGRNLRAVYWESSTEWLWGSIWRTPVYAWFCGACEITSGEAIVSIVAAQAALSLATVAVVFFSARQVFGLRTAAWAATVLSLDPLSITHTGLIRSETLFVFLLVLGYWLWMQSIMTDSSSRGLIGSLTLGLSALTRPIAMYLLAVLAPMNWLLKPSGRKLLSFLVLVIGFSLPLAGWAVRNHALTGSFVISTIDGTNLLYYRAAGAIAEEERTERATVAKRLQRELATFRGADPVETARREKAFAVELLIRHPRGAVIGFVKGSIRMLLGPGDEATSQLFGLQSTSRFRPQLRALALGWSLAYLVALYSFVALGIMVLVRHRDYRMLGILLACPAYFLLISSGPEAYSRFRLPLMPFLATLAGLGISGMRSSRGLVASPLPSPAEEAAP